MKYPRASFTVQALLRSKSLPSLSFGAFRLASSSPSVPRARAAAGSGVGSAVEVDACGGSVVLSSWVTSGSDESNIVVVVVCF